MTELNDKTIFTLVSIPLRQVLRKAVGVELISSSAACLYALPDKRR